MILDAAAVAMSRCFIAKQMIVRAISKIDRERQFNWQNMGNFQEVSMFVWKRSKRVLRIYTLQLNLPKSTTYKKIFI